MLTKDQAAILHDLAIESLGIGAETGEVESTPVHDVPKVADALASLAAVRDGDGARESVIGFLEELITAFEGDEEWFQRGVDLLRELGGRAPVPEYRAVPTTMLTRGHVAVAVEGYVPRETMVALLRIGHSIIPAPMVGEVSVTPTSLAWEVERLAATARRHALVIAEVEKLLHEIDPSDSSEVTATSVELARRKVEQLRERCESAEKGERAADREVDRLRAKMENRSHDHRTGRANYWRSPTSQRYACWWSEVEPREIMEVDARSPQDAALSFFMRKMSENHVHDNVPDFDRVAVVDMGNPSNGHEVNVKITFETSTEIPF